MPNPVLKYLSFDFTNKVQQLVSFITSSAGSADGGKPVATDPTTGQIHPSLLPDALIRTVTASENIAAGAPVNVYDSGSGVMKIRNADATADGKRADGYILTAVITGATVQYNEGGVIAGLSGLTVGAMYYLAATPGGIVTTPPSAVGNVVQQVGKALSATELQWEPSVGFVIAS